MSCSLKPLQCAGLAILLFLAVLNGCKQRRLTDPTTQMNIEQQFWVRVLLFDNIKDCSLKMDSPFSVTNQHTQIEQVHFDRFDTPVRINLDAGRISFAGWGCDGNEITIKPDKPYVFNINGSDYRGNLTLILNHDSNSFGAVNLVPIDPYLAGVIGAEMPGYWESAALQAQAIAARSYCLYIKKRFGRNRHWDVRRTQANQVYDGLAVESAQIWDTVNSTSGQVLTCREPNEKWNIFPAYYSSACGGHTENSQNVFGPDKSGVTTLTGVPCPYCRKVARQNFFSWPTVQMEKSFITKRLQNRYPSLNVLGNIEKIIPTQSKYKDFSRLTSVKLVGSTGKTGFLIAEDFRLAIDPTGLKIKSACFEIVDMNDKWALESGRGFGHGVGLCQCGAQAQAREGKTAVQILRYYYPNSKIEKIY
ncbi:hypothetical protein ES708_03483 [subsurface metagenome]